MRNGRGANLEEEGQRSISALGEEDQIFRKDMLVFSYGTHEYCKGLYQ